MSNASADLRLLAAPDIVRGVVRLFHHLGLAAIAEVPLRNGRRADVMAVDGKGEITICEIKVALGDLRGDTKWVDYLDYCDRYFWAVPAGFPRHILDEAVFLPETSGLVVADRFNAAIMRPAAVRPLNAARRRTEILRFGRTAASRLQRLSDPFLGDID